MLVERLKTKYNIDEPIFTSEILELFNEYSKAYVFRLIDEAEKQGEIINYNNGVYYIPIKTIIGPSTITAEDVINKKYISYKNDVYGIYSGLNLQNMFSITTQMSNTIEVVTNNESTRCRTIMVDGRTVILRKSRCKIDSSNVKAYTILQLLSEIEDVNYINDRAKESIIRYIKENKITYNDLILLAKYFPGKTLKNLMYSEVLNDFTQG